jgi:tripartite ATP-independent transporter DctM subunit
MILFALITFQSIPGCWLATIGPAILTIIVFSIFNYFMTRKMPLKLLPKASIGEQVKYIALSTRKATFALLLPVIILGGIYGGIATPTESACVSVIYVILVSKFIFKTLSLKTLFRSFISAATTTGVLIIMLFFVMINTRIMTMEQLPQEMASWIMDISSNKYVILIMVNIFLLIIGMIMDDISGTILAASLLFPVMSKLGIHPLHFAAILGVNLGLGNVTPPTAPILFLSGRIGNCRIEKYMTPALILMIGGLLPVVIATTYWPDLSLFLPRLFGFAS